jgi:hypothetical protein
MRAKSRRLFLESLEPRHALAADMIGEGEETPPMPPPMPAFGDVTVLMTSTSEGNEGGTDMLFPVTFNASMPYPGGFTVSYRTYDESAVAGEDYEQKSGTITFSGTPGETQNVVVRVTGDKIVEVNEQLRLKLTAVDKPNISLQEDPAIGFIENDEFATVELRYREGYSQEVHELDVGGASKEFWYEIKLDGLVDVPVDVIYQFVLFDAEREDFLEYPEAYEEKQVTLSSNGSVFKTVTIAPDNTVEPRDMFFIRIKRLESRGRDVRAGESLVGEIIDNDRLKLTVGNLAQTEGTGTGTTEFRVPITLGNKVEGGVELSFQTIDYTAGAGEHDFDMVVQTLHFAEEETSAHVIVNVNKDDQREANEKFTVNFTMASAPWIPDLQIEYTGAIQGPHGSWWAEPFGLVTIMNDDEGVYTNTGGGSIAFYNGGDGTTGQEFRLAAQSRYAVSVDVRSWADLLAALQSHVAINGRVSEIAIFDHGWPSGQWVGSGIVDRQSFEALAPFLNDGALLWLAGCWVGSNPFYCDWISDDAGPGARVRACDHLVWYPSVTPQPGFSWILFDGYEKG